MGYSEERLLRIFEKTDGNCHICHGTLELDDYGAPADLDGWEVEHSVPRAMGGTDHLNNLFPAHVTCNRQKHTSSTRSARALHGKTRAPYSKAKRDKIRAKNMLGGALTGAFSGGLTGGRSGALVGALFGGLLGVVIVPK